MSARTTMITVNTAMIETSEPIAEKTALSNAVS